MEWVFIEVSQPDLIGLEHMFFEIFSEEANAFHIDKFDFQSEEMVGYGYVEILLEVQLGVLYSFRAQGPWLHTQAHKDVVVVGEVDDFVYRHEYFAPCIPICAVHLAYHILGRLHFRAHLYFLLESLKDHVFEFWVVLTSVENYWGGQEEAVCVVIVGDQQYIFPD